ncbi:MFS transporter [Synoicihabitans lomoniglobus]|uniref:MFS transporter n=1 Tax=Synoicihabitans lomoniglobus TaxID=2909285 RepID=A0AAF0I3L2_9BACT|nr:MFS transporter [Opitutaceae bacterium LMO-M01]WED65985.1 MFS transporter [Opitutaceae bacterium LMO-M01]
MSDSSPTAAAVSPATAQRLLYAGFTAILATAIGFAIRGGILDNWGSEFGFTATQLGVIGGAGFTGFCFGIFAGGLVVDKIGYGKLVIVAFALHIVSAVVTLAPTTGMAIGTVYNYLFWGTFTFALANGTLEAVANPLVATLFPDKRTHYLNILHASWPLGLVLGGLMGWLLDDKMQVSWKLQVAMFLIPTVIYGVMFWGQRYPRSEAAEKGLSLGAMFKDVGLLGGTLIAVMLGMFFRATFPDLPVWIIVVGALAVIGAIGRITGFALGAWMLFVLFGTHIMVGAVELGTDGWIQNITGNILSSEQGKMLFVFTSLCMFILRFCADWIERKIGLSPVGLLLACAVIASLGLNLVSGITSFGGALLALTVYSIGKTFFWPTMLAIVGDRFPRTGAIAMSIMGGLGMMSAGLIGLPGLGYAKDRFASEALAASAPQVYAASQVEEPSGWLIFRDVAAIDGRILGEAKATPAPARTPADHALVAADQAGDRKTLRVDAFIPIAMAVVYLGLLLFFKSRGGYRRVTLDANGTASGS